MRDSVRVDVANVVWLRLEPALVRIELADIGPGNVVGEGLVIEGRGPAAMMGGPNLRSRGIFTVDEVNVEFVCICLVTVAGVSAKFLL